MTVVFALAVGCVLWVLFVAFFWAILQGGGVRT